MDDKTASQLAAEWAIELLGGPVKAARVLNVKDHRHQTVQSWARNRVPIEYCPAIERETNFAIRRWDLRPDDWHRIWPELIGAEGAPAVPETEGHGDSVAKAA